MTEQEIRSFLAQFDKAREDFKTWPKWMQDAAVERAATFPKPAAHGVKGRTDADYDLIGESGLMRGNVGVRASDELKGKNYG